MGLGEIQELIDTTLEESTEDNLMEMGASEPVPDDEEEDVEEAELDNLAEAFLLLKTAFDSFSTWTPPWHSH